jgi:hypothetical protein
MIANWMKFQIGLAGNQNGISLKLTLGWPCSEKDFNNPKSLREFHR